jgi:predicted O-linked N-acetylglucosamine transferase (SPINDLY family)
MKAAHKQKSDALRKARQQWELGLACHKRRDYTEALKCFELALKLQPRDALYRMNAARTCLELNRDNDALAHAQAAIELDPACDIAVTLRARALHRLNRHDEVLEVLDTLPPDRRDNREYWSARGVAMQGTGRHHEAIQDFLKALAYCMDDASTHYRMGVSFYELGLKEEAAECFRTGLILGLGASALHVHGMLAYAERENCRWTQADEQLERMRILVDETPPTNAMMTAPFAHATLSADPLHQLKASALMSNLWRNVRPAVRVPRVTTPPRLRVGYLSADFHQHATSVLMCELFEQHDRSLFEIFAYSTGVDDKSAMRRRIEAAVEHFVDVKGQPDQAIAQRIADDDLDLLIDLKGYTAGNRMGVLARRPAPLQAAFLGFPATTGAHFIDYIIGDPVVTPAEHAHHFSEKIAQMPVCYQPNDRKRPLPQPMTRAQAGLPEGKLVLCGFNQSYKISAEVLDVWTELLNDLPDAVLWLLDWHGQARPNLMSELAMRGIGPERVLWAPRWDLAPHISRMALADIFIDTWPCNAHTTASDALWAGLPVVTYVGKTFASRVASSLLNACDLPELVCDSIDAYKSCVLNLAADSAARQVLRQRLDVARQSSRLFDSQQFARDYEALLNRMIQRYRSGLPPDTLT